MKISYSVVLYNNSCNQIRNITYNICDTVPSGYEYQIFLINNSPDNLDVESTIRALQIELPNIYIITAEKNNGFGAGHNLAISVIKSDYHIIVNPDVYIPDKSQIRKIVDFMNEKDVILVSPLIKGNNGKIQELVKKNPTVFDMGIRFLGPHVFSKRQSTFTNHGKYNSVINSSNLSGSFMVFRTPFLKIIHGFDERYFLYMEDADISRSMSLYGKTVYYPDAFVIHEWQRANKYSLVGIVRMISSMCKYFNKWGWKLK